MMDLFITKMELFTSQDIEEFVSSGLLVDYCNFLTAVWTLILTVPIHSLVRK